MTDTPLTDIAVTTLDGRDTTLGELAGGAALVVNVASKCGLTPPQYTALEKLAEDYRDRGLTVIGVPCNQFMGQEPGTARRSRSSARRPTGVTFPLLAKTDVNGAERHPLYAELTKRPTTAVKPATSSGTSRSSCSRRAAPWSSGSGRAPSPTPPEVIAAIEDVLPPIAPDGHLTSACPKPLRHRVLPH